MFFVAAQKGFQLAQAVLGAVRRMQEGDRIVPGQRGFDLVPLEQPA